MAAATSKLNINAYPYGSTTDQVQQVIYGQCALSVGGTYVTNGVPITWTFFNPDGSIYAPTFSGAQNDPIVAYFTSLTGGVNGGTAVYSYLYDQTHNTLRIFAGAVELGNGVAITADTIGFEAHFAKFV